MKALIALLAAIAVAGCAGGFDRSGSRSAAAGASAPAAASCTGDGQGTASGGMSCQGGTYYRCASGSWQQTALSCSR